MRPSIACVFVLAAVVRAGGAASTVDTPHLTAAVSASHASVAPGGRVSLFADIVPKAKMHVYAPQQKDYIPITLTLQLPRGVRAGEPVFPAPEKYFFAPLKETQLVYTAPFRIVQDVTFAPAAALRKAGLAPGATVTLSGTLRYQACDDAICYLPKSVPVSWTIKVDAPSMK